MFVSAKDLILTFNLRPTIYLCPILFLLVFATGVIAAQDQDLRTKQAFEWVLSLVFSLFEVAVEEEKAHCDGAILARRYSVSEEVDCLYNAEEFLPSDVHFNLKVSHPSQSHCRCYLAAGDD